MQDLDLQIRALGPGDTDKLLSLSQSLAWDYTRQYWQIILTTGSVVGAFDEAGDLIATGSIIHYPKSHCFVGAVIVAASYQGCGIGKNIMQLLHDKIDRKDVPAHLISTSEGKSLYQKLGYEVIDTCFKMVRESADVAGKLSDLNGMSYMPVTSDLMPKIIEFDHSYFKADRSHLLVALHEGGYSGICLQDKQSGEIKGYAFQIDRAAHLCIGPVVALNEAYALSLCQMLSYGKTRALRIDSFSNQESFRRGLETLGFKLIDKAPLMVRGSPASVAPKENAFALISQAFG